MSRSAPAPFPRRECSFSSTTRLSPDMYSLPTSTRGGCCYSLHFTDDKTESSNLLTQVTLVISGRVRIHTRQLSSRTCAIQDVVQCHDAGGYLPVGTR